MRIVALVFGTNGFSEIVNKKGVNTIKVAPFMSQTKATPDCLLRPGHNLIPFVVTTKYGQQLVITDGKAHRDTTIEMTPTLTPTLTPSARGNPTFDPDAFFNYVNIRAINDTQAFVF